MNRLRLPILTPVSILFKACLTLLLIILLNWVAFQEAALAQPTALAQSIQPYLDRIARQISEFTLDNGMRFIVLERHQAPVISFMIYADVGAVNEADGKTGVAHYLEHLAFKGTQKIGTTNYEAERELQKQMDQTFNQLLEAEAAGDGETAAALQAELEELQLQAAVYIEQNKYGQIIDQAGGVGLNASTGADSTRYFYRLPSNKLELWMSLESERFLEPVFREFFQEKDVILEERRVRVDNSPIGKMVEEFQAAAFKAHPYRRPVIGYEDDLYRTTRQDIQDFYDTYYGPSNLVAAVVGDVDPKQVKLFAETYFGRYASKALPPEIAIDEPPQTDPREFTLQLPSEPWYLEGYHRPSLSDPNHVIYGIIESLLVGGRTSRLYEALVSDAQIALDVGGLNGFPGDKYSNIFLLYALTAPDHTLDEIATLFQQEIRRLQEEPVANAELDRVKTQARAGLLRNLKSNSGIAALLSEYEAKTGSWRNVFQDLDDIEAVSAEDVQRIAQELFRTNNRTVGKLISNQSIR